MKDKTIIIFIILIGILFYGLTLRGSFGNPRAADIKNNLDQATKAFELSPERGRFTHLIAMAENETYELSPELTAVAYPDVGHYQDRHYSYFAPGIPYMVLPFYKLGAQYNMSQIFSFAFMSIITIISLLFLYKIARQIIHLPMWSSLLAVLVFAFASTSWSYAITLYQHHLTTFFILSSLYGVWKYSYDGKYSWLWGVLIWFNYATAIMIDYPNALLLLPVIFYFLAASFKIYKEKYSYTISFRFSFILTMLAFMLVSFFHLKHNIIHYGAWHHLSGSLASYELPSTNILELPIQASDQVKNVALFFNEQDLLHGLHTLLFSEDRGLFFYSPIFILALGGLLTLLNHHIGPFIKTLLMILIINIFLYGSWGDPWGGWAYGPRYLIPSMAILSLFVALYMTKYGHHLYAKISAFVLIAVSSAIALLGALTSNAVPPKWEAIGLENLYNYKLNIRFLMNNQSGSFFYNQYLNQYISLQAFYFSIYIFLLIIFLSVIFVLPTYANKTKRKN